MHIVVLKGTCIWSHRSSARVSIYSSLPLSSPRCSGLRQYCAGPPNAGGSERHRARAVPLTPLAHMNGRCRQHKHSWPGDGGHAGPAAASRRCTAVRSRLTHTFDERRRSNTAPRRVRRRWQIGARAHVNHVLRGSEQRPPPAVPSRASPSRDTRPPRESPACRRCVSAWIRWMPTRCESADVLDPRWKTAFQSQPVAAHQPAYSRDTVAWRGSTPFPAHMATYTPKREIVETWRGTKHVGMHSWRSSGMFWTSVMKCPRLICDTHRWRWPGWCARRVEALGWDPRWPYRSCRPARPCAPSPRGPWAWPRRRRPRRRCRQSSPARLQHVARHTSARRSCPLPADGRRRWPSHWRSGAEPCTDYLPRPPTVAGRGARHAPGGRGVHAARGGGGGGGGGNARWWGRFNEGVVQPLGVLQPNDEAKRFPSSIPSTLLYWVQ